MIEIKSIWDNGGETVDRYTVVVDSLHTGRAGLFDALGLSSNPTSPQGFSQWTCAQEGEHLGKKVDFDDLPGHIQEHIIERLS
jgi:hypothetical protein